MRIILLVFSACLLLLAEARRVQIRPRVPEPQVYYEEEEDSQATEDDYAPAIYQPRPRALHTPRSKDTMQSSKQPPVQTIRNYNKVNDDGSFTFGYEAADGSFKEETRGTDCVVRGKYGYVDPDGNKREFTYVSGNPCDPNAPKDEDDDRPEKQEDDDLNGPANYPSVRPVPRPVRPTYQTTTTRAPTTIFQTQYQLDDEASQELDDEQPIIKAQARPSAFRRPERPTYVQVAVTPNTPIYESLATASPAQHYRLATSPSQYQTTAAPAHRAQSTVSSAVYQTVEATTRRPATTARLQRPQSVDITPRPHIAQVAAQYVSPSSSNTERPGIVFAQTYRPHAASSLSAIPQQRTTTASPASHLDFAAELERYVNTVAVQQSPKPQPVSPSKSKLGQSSASGSAEPIYQSALIYDPATGQYNTQLYQTLPQTVGDFSLSHKLQPFVAQPQTLLGLQQLQQIQQQQQQIQQQQQQIQQHQQQKQSPLYKNQQSAISRAVAQPQEVLYRKQQSELLHQSQQLYAQQQRRQQQQQHPQRLQVLESSRIEPQAFYYVAPQTRPAGNSNTQLSVGQIDQFLRSGSGRY